MNASGAGAARSCSFFVQSDTADAWAGVGPETTSPRGRSRGLGEAAGMKEEFARCMVSEGPGLTEVSAATTR